MQPWVQPLKIFIPLCGERMPLTSVKCISIQNPFKCNGASISILSRHKGENRPGDIVCQSAFCLNFRVCHGCVITGILVAGSTNKKALFGGTALLLAGLCLLLAAAAPHGPIIGAPHPCEPLAEFRPLLLADGSARIVDAQVTAVAALAVHGALLWEGLAVGLFLNCHQPPQLLQLCGTIHREHHPFTVMVGFRAVINITDFRAELIPLRLKLLPFLFAENEHKIVAVLPNIDGEDRFRTLAEFQLLLSVSQLVQAVFSR